MRKVTSRLTLEKLDHLPETGLFDRVPMDDPNLTESFFQDAVRDGAVLYHLLDDARTALALVCFLWDDKRHEVELLAAQSLTSDYVLSQEALPLLENMAREMGARSLRVSTLRKPIIGFLQHAGYRIAEVTLRKDF